MMGRSVCVINRRGLLRMVGVAVGVRDQLEGEGGANDWASRFSDLSISMVFSLSTCSGDLWLCPLCRLR